jgi:hypothetical protein
VCALSVVISRRAQRRIVTLAQCATRAERSRISITLNDRSLAQD